MICNECRGTGLKDQNNICPACKGFGVIEGVEEAPEAVVEAPVKEIKKAKKK
jgi:DnaJ-class molecular chaperone